MTVQPGASAWRQFTFFEVGEVKDAHDLGSTPEVFKSTPEISTIGSTSLGVLIADIHGSLHLLGQDFDLVRSWVAHVAGRVTHMAEHKGILVTLGEEDSTRLPLLKVWDMEHADKRTGVPALLRSVKVQTGSRPHPVSTVSLSAELTHLAIGLGDGTVLLYRHFDQSLFSGSASLTSLPKPKVVHESPTEPITGLGFREPRASEEGDPKAENLYLLIVTLNNVLSYQVSGKGSGATPVVVDEVGAALGCVTMDYKALDMVIARDEAVYICGPEGRGACYAYEGPKSSIRAYHNYLIIISPPFVPSAASASATVRNYVARANSLAASQSDISKLTVFDLENKFVAYSGTFKEGVRDVICAWGQIFVLGNDGKLSRLEEKPTSQKFDILFRKSFYLLALSLAKTSHLDQATIADIHRQAQYGDHLYSKGDYEGAVGQYVKTLGFLQPSYVVRKFLDAQRIHNLTTYLQELHNQGLANSDHTTLLLNTYTKLKDVASLDKFIKADTSSSNGVNVNGTNANGSVDKAMDEDELPFDLETVIRVCRQAGYFSHAVYLAKKYERHEDYIRIQIEDVGNFGDAIRYIRGLGVKAAESNLARYGFAMLNSLSDETTQLLIDLCTSSADFSETAVLPTSPTKVQTTNNSYMAYLSLGPRASIALPSDTPIVPPSPTMSATQTTSKQTSGTVPTQIPQKASAHARQKSLASYPTSLPEASRADSPPPTAKPARTPPSPRLYFAHFVDHPEHFIKFLEAVAMSRWGQTLDGPDPPSPPQGDNVNAEVDQADRRAVWNTLLELYLTLSDNYMSTDPPSPEKARSLKAKAIRLLNCKDGTLNYDHTHALIVCSARGFTEGLVLLWEKLGMFEEILRFWMDKERESGLASSRDSTAQGQDERKDQPSFNVLQHLNLYGPSNPQLYPLVLRFLTSSDVLLKRHQADLASILDHIEDEKIMPPLGVVQVLSRNGVASVGLVKQWLMARIAESRDEIDADQRLINSYREETRAKLQEVAELGDSHNPRVFHVTRCSACGVQLDLPSVHFMCKHSYHQRCLADHETECPNCARQHGVLREIRRNNERLADRHDVFLADVVDNGFSAVASAFSRGLLGTTTAEVGS